MLVRILMVVMLALLLSPLAAADKGRKLYKWTDKDGNIHYSDSIPPEAKEYARERLSNQGVSVEQVDRAMTPEDAAFATAVVLVLLRDERRSAIKA